MFWREFKEAVHQRLSDKPYLKPIFDDIHDIAQRIREVDPSLFIVFNRRSKKMEVHSLEHRPNTYAWTIPFDALDQRTVTKAYENRIERINKYFLMKLDEHNRKVDQSAERDFEREVHARSLEFAKIVSRLE